jgi:hypothetical protein
MQTLGWCKVKVPRIRSSTVGVPLRRGEVSRAVIVALSAQPPGVNKLCVCNLVMSDLKI